MMHYMQKPFCNVSETGCQARGVKEEHINLLYSKAIMIIVVEIMCLNS